MKHKLFSCTGVEAEYMIVNRETLDVLPVADELLYALAGRYECEVVRGHAAWSNELVRHVIELKVNEPATDLHAVARLFQRQVRDINGLLAELGGRLMPGGAHPWMDPVSETELWPHEYVEVYRAFDHIFNCRSHGWANLQSIHINLPFANDDEFGRLHAAIRVLLPLMPALAASTPVIGGLVTGLVDTRLDKYRHHTDRVEILTGDVIPEPVFTEAAYRREIFEKLYEAIRPFDPDGTLQHEWLNARGAIARFDRDAIEIRVLDMQECPAADLAVVHVIVEVLRALVDQRWSSLRMQQRWAVRPLQDILVDTMRDGGEAVLTDRAYLRLFGGSAREKTAQGLWVDLVNAVLPADDWARPALERILREGTLARRILRVLGAEPDLPRMRAVYGKLCDCLVRGRMLVADDTGGASSAPALA
jgi:gamma-glutamyl:cysteine ligase YbdK (ATP-grasp superfamily)